MKHIHLLYTLMTLILLGCCHLRVNAQQLRVESFSFDELDLTANLMPVKAPHNGRKCALIKVHTALQGLSFSGDVYHIVKTEVQNQHHPNEVWLYVMEEMKYLTISHPQRTPIEKYHWNIPLQSAKTYHLVLLSDEGDDTRQKYQYAVFSVNLPEARLQIDGSRPENMQLDQNGRAAFLLPFGKHSYLVMADGYKEKRGSFEVSDEVHFEDIVLETGHGLLSVASAPTGATVTLDRVAPDSYMVQVVAKNHYTEWQSTDIAALKTTELHFAQEEAMYKSIKVNTVSF